MMDSECESTLSTQSVPIESEEDDVNNFIVQGRGRGYRTRRPRGRGHAPRRRGVVRRSGSRGITRADVAIENTEQRHILLNKKIDELNEEEAKKLLKKTVEMCPGLIFNLIEERVSSGQGYHPPYDSQQPSWCVCTNCREMPTELERVCCNRHPDSCISRLPDFSVLILDEGVLALARLYRQEILVLPAENDLSKANRHSAYRQFVLWHHGRLGEGIRRVIPSCCVWRIRDRFPDSFGQYSGFIPSRFN